MTLDKDRRRIGDIQPPLQRKCEHKFTHLETLKHREIAGFYSEWHKNDRFFCEKCLEIKEIKQVGNSREQPTWY